MSWTAPIVLAALALVGTAAVTQRYAGAWWLWLAFLLAGGFAAGLVGLRWRTCLGRTRTRHRQADDLARF